MYLWNYRSGHDVHLTVAIDINNIIYVNKLFFYMYIQKIKLVLKFFMVKFNNESC